MKIDLERREIICGNLKELVKFLDISQEDLAKEVGVNPMTVSMWCQKRHVPRQSTWIALRFVCETLSKEIYGNPNAVSPAFDIPGVKMTDLINWQINLSKSLDVPSYIGS